MLIVDLNNVTNIELTVGQKIPRNVLLDVPLEFISTILVRGKKELKVNDHRYPYRQG